MCFDIVCVGICYLLFLFVVVWFRIGETLRVVGLDRICYVFGLDGQDGWSFSRHFVRLVCAHCTHAHCTVWLHFARILCTFARLRWFHFSLSFCVCVRVCACLVRAPHFPHTACFADAARFLPTTNVCLVLLPDGFATTAHTHGLHDPLPQLVGPSIYCLPLDSPPACSQFPS